MVVLPLTLVGLRALTTLRVIIGGIGMTGATSVDRDRRLNIDVRCRVIVVDGATVVDGAIIVPTNSDATVACGHIGATGLAIGGHSAVTAQG